MRGPNYKNPPNSKWYLDVGDEPTFKFGYSNAYIAQLMRASTTKS